MQTADRAIAIVELLARHAAGLPLSSIADQLVIPRSATHRLLADLREQGYVRQDFEGGSYRLTARMVALGLAYLAISGVTSGVQPIVDRLAERTGELVVLTAVDSDRLIRILKAQGARRGLFYHLDESSEVYLASTSNGHAWLSCLEEDHVLRLVGRQGLKRDVDGPNAPKTIRELLDYLAAAKKRGYAQVFDTYVPGTSAMAAPIFRAGTRIPIGTMSVAGPIVRMTPQKMEQVAPVLLASAAEISEIAGSLPIFEQPAAETPHV